MVYSMWLFKHMFHADGILSRYKARLVANGNSQQLGVDFDETFSLVVKPATIHTVLSLGSQVAYLLIYVDDIILTASFSDTLQQIIASLHSDFDMTDLGALNYFIGISVDRTFTGLFLSQKKYALQLFERAHMVNCKTPVDTKSKLGLEGVPVHYPTLYRSLARGLQYLTFTRPDLSYAVQQIFLYNHDPRETHFAALKRILRYVWETGDNLLSWSAKRQHTLSRSSIEAEYRGVANVVSKITWLHNLLCELHSSLSIVTLVRVLHVPFCYQYADIFTKGLPSTLFEEFRSSLSVRVLYVPSRYQYADIFTKGAY
ncbi:ribonuclease H-like domain-containing protein [Tanacetum coccineum]